MKSIFVLILLIVFHYTAIAQRYSKPRTYKAMILTEVSRACNKEYEKHLKESISHKLATALRKSIPCLSIITEGDISALIFIDRHLTLTGVNEGNLEKIGEKMDVDFLISIGISCSGEKVMISENFLDRYKNKVINRDVSPWVSEDEVSREMERMAATISRLFFCPYQGTFLYSTSTKTEVNESKEWTSEDGKYSTSHTKKHTIEMSETWDLKVRINNSPEGNYTGYFLNDYKFDSDIRGKCLKYENGAFVDIFEGSGNSSEHVEKKDELKISGLGYKGNKYLDTNAYFKLVFDTDSTYKIIIKAISNEELGTRTYYHQMNYSCPGRPHETIKDKTRYAELKTLDRIFGPYRGKPSDKQLTQKITTDIPVENGTSTETIYFNLNR